MENKTFSTVTSYMTFVFAVVISTTLREIMRTLMRQIFHLFYLITQK